MINNKTVIGVIPARGGSKRCPRKNIKEFRGKPLIQWAHESAVDSKYIDHLIVSTEDHEIMQVALKLDYDVVIRPKKFATDDATNEDVLRHVLSYCHHDIIVLLQPTSPLRTVDDIDWCIGEVEKFDKPCMSYNKEDLKKNGAVYCCTSEWLNKGHDFDMFYCLPHYMPIDRGLDIDYPEQFND